MWMEYKWRAAKCNMEGMINENVEKNEIHFVFFQLNVKVELCLDGRVKLSYESINN